MDCMSMLPFKQRASQVPSRARRHCGAGRVMQSERDPCNTTQFQITDVIFDSNKSKAGLSRTSETVNHAAGLAIEIIENRFQDGRLKIFDSETYEKNTDPFELFGSLL